MTKNAPDLPPPSPGMAEARRMYQRHDAGTRALELEDRRATPRPKPPAIAGQRTLEDALEEMEAAAFGAGMQRRIRDLRVELDRARRPTPDDIGRAIDAAGKALEDR